MKRIAKALVIVTFASAATAAFAADIPADVQNETPLSQEFPKMDTYKKEHRDSVANQAPMTWPSVGRDNYSQTDEFPNIVTYAKQHANDPVRASNTSAFPENLSSEPSMADEGLVAGIAGVAPYVSPSNQAAVGATR